MKWSRDGVSAGGLEGFSPEAAGRRVAASVQSSENRYRALFDAVPVGVYSCDASGVIENFNHHAAELWGRAPALGDTDERFCGSFKLFRPDGSFMPHAQCPMAEVVSGQRSEVRDAEVLIERPDGTRVTVVVNIRQQQNESGDVSGAINCFYDITERKEVEEKLRVSEQRFARFMQHLPGLAWIKDSEGRYVYANDAAETAFRVSRDELYGKSDREIFSPATAAQFAENDRRALDSNSSIQTIEALTHADAVVHYSVVNKFAIPAPDGKAVMVGGVAIDITELKQAEEALAKADRDKNEFLAMLAHELRNPLAPILASIEILRLARQSVDAVGIHPKGDQGTEDQSLASPDLSGNIDHALKVLQRQVGQMVRLVDDLLDAGRISRGPIDLRRERCELSAVLSDVVDAIRPLAAGRTQALNVTLPTTPVYLNADPTRLAQILGNLLNNASKFTRRDGQLWLTAELAKDATTVAIRVRDSGVGIAADQLEHIFDLFAQVDTSLERSVNGLGIGLTLAKALTEMHGGTLEVTSAGLGQGSEFVVRLPIDAGTDPPARLTMTAPGPPPPLRILIVDDSHDAADSLAILLRLEGHETFTAHDGLAAVEATTALRPDLVLMDIGLPALNGYEAARKIRQQESKKSRPFLVALTGWGNSEDRSRSEAAGFDAHVVKPVDGDALGRLIAGLGVRNQTERR